MHPPLRLVPYHRA